jgi:Xaa-Pro aminopeptidase
MNIPTIPDSEFAQRIERARQLAEEAGYDALLVNSNEADLANVRYFSDYWPIFEIAGVLIPVEGKPALLIGPESETFARDRSKIATVYKMLEYRESADPAYPACRSRHSRKSSPRPAWAIPNASASAATSSPPLRCWTA